MAATATAAETFPKDGDLAGMDSPDRHDNQSSMDDKSPTTEGGSSAHESGSSSPHPETRATSIDGRDSPLAMHKAEKPPASEKQTTPPPPPEDASADTEYPPLQSMPEIGHPLHPSATKAGGIRFAPLYVPLERRLQMAVVLWHCMTYAFFIALFIALCTVPLLWPVLLAYVVHIYLTNKGRDGTLAPSEWFRSLPMWRWLAAYFPMRLHKTHDLPPTRKYIMGYHPHGIIAIGAWAAFGTNALGFSKLFPGIANSVLTLDSNFSLPFNRDYLLAAGVSSVSKESITNLLTKGGVDGQGMGRAVTIVVGGARESLLAQPGTMRLILDERKGFVKLAIRLGADLVPVLSFGEVDIYQQLAPEKYPRVAAIQHAMLRWLKFTLPMIQGRGLLNYDVGLMPHRRPINIVVGKPIRVTTPEGGEPSQDDIDRVHGEYVAELQRVWDTYKDQFAPHRVGVFEVVG
jgi:2-acylglycerol O-acyltransferase 2